jgi:NAD-dependent DNA ligase
MKKQLLNKIEELKLDPITFILNNNSDTILEIIKYANKEYHNNISIITDDIYDLLIDIIKDLEPEHPIFKMIGSKVVKQKVKLPYYMGSMDKIKSEDINLLNKWINNNKLSYVYSDKLDGVSALLINNKNKLNLYKRGDGNIGTDISNLIKYIPNLQNIILSENMCVRGELIISIENFKKYQNNMANARNMVSGIVNSKKINIDIIKDLEFVVYELVNPWIINQLEQWKILEEHNFKVVYHNKINNLTIESLSKHLINRKNNSEYEIDGIIICSNTLPNNRYTYDNPPYAFAYKDNNLLETANVEILNVEWTISKDGYLKPKLNCKPTKLDGVIISNITAFNAKYIKDNILGPGAIVKIIRSCNVIPHILKIIKIADSGQPQFPDIDYEWTDSNVDIVVKHNTNEQKIKELTFFFKKLDIKNIDEKIVEKLINANINTIKKIIEIKLTDLNNIEGFKDRMINKVYTNIIDKIKNISLLDLAIASNYFGHGIGKKKIEKIMNIYPNIIELYNKYDNDNIINKIIDIEGFDIKTATQFVNNLSKFVKLYESLKDNIKKQLINNIKIKKIDSMLFENMIIVFTGFRDNELEDFIIKNGGKINSSISLKTSLIISTEEAINKNTNIKILKAKELNIPIISKENFIKKYKL